MDRGALQREVSPDAPSGPCLRQEGRYDAVRDAASAQFADPTFGLPEKRPDWPLAEQICRDALETETKDLYLAVAYAEAATHNRGAEGLLDGVWLLRELHTTFWDSFHPRPSGQTPLEPRTRLLELLVRKLTPLLRDWVSKRIIAPGPELTAARTEIIALDDLVRDRYGASAVAVTPLLEPLDALVATAPEPVAPPAQSTPPPLAPTPTAIPAPPEPRGLTCLAARLMVWTDIVREVRDQGLPTLAPPDPARRAHLEQLFTSERWHDVIAAVDATLATAPQAHLWLDLHRYTAGALWQLGGEHRDQHRWLLACLGAFLDGCRGLAEASFADGTPVADPATRAWLAQEVTPAVATCSPRRPTLPEATPADADSRRTRHIADRQHASELLSAGHAMAAAGLLRRLADELHRHDLATWEGPAFAASTLSLLCQAYDELASRGVTSSTLQDRRFTVREALAGLAPNATSDSNF